MKESIGMLLKKAMLEFDKKANQMLAKYDLTHTQHKTLMMLYSAPPMSVRQIDIERYFSMTNPTVTGILQTMERKGLISRVPNPMDRRSKVIVLTSKSMQMREELYQWSDDFDSLVSNNLSEEELDLLISLLKKMIGTPKTIYMTHNTPPIFYPKAPSEMEQLQANTALYPVLPQDAPFAVQCLRWEFEQDLDRGVEIYGQKRFEVTGIVTKIGADNHSIPSVELSDNLDSMSHAVCSFPNAKPYSQINVGDRVVIRGNYLVLSNWFGLVMRNCELLDVKKS